MRSKVKTQNRFIRIITIPARALSKARDFYVKSMTGYADKVAMGHSMAMPGDGQFLRSFSSSSALRADNNDSDDFRELVRAASVRSYGHKNEVDMYLKELIKQQQQQRQMASKGLPKATSVRSVGMGKIEEGEEDKEGSSRRGG